jgi:hypothetical protein
MEKMNITSAQYQDPEGNGRHYIIKATINGTEMFVPLDPDNTEYAEILRQVAAGELTIEEAD